MVIAALCSAASSSTDCVRRLGHPLKSKQGRRDQPCPCQRSVWSARLNCCRMSRRLGNWPPKSQKHLTAVLLATNNSKQIGLIAPTPVTIEKLLGTRPRSLVSPLYVLRIVRPWASWPKWFSKSQCTLLDCSYL